jgi:DNA/RNA-binding domain of Phe-tRNA-synthetase-like protein
MRFMVDSALFEHFPGLVIGVVVARGLHTPADPGMVEKMLAAAEEDMRAEWQDRPAQEHPRIAPWREAFRTMGLSANKMHSSIEALARRVLGGKGAPRVLPLVDFYNAVSLRHRIPMGGHDLDTLEGDIRLGYTAGNEPFQAMFSDEVEQVASGEVAYLDTAEVLTRHWVWRQSHKDRMRPESADVFVPVDGLGEVGEGVVRLAVQEAERGLATLFGARTRTGLLTVDTPVMELED